MEENKFKFPTETIELPSKGYLYPEGHPLASGTVEMKYMTAKEEDILTNQSYIRKGVVFDRLLKSLITTEGVNLEDLVVGDKNALLVAARILGYGANYSFTANGEEYSVDLSVLEHKEFNPDNFTKGKNELTFTLPYSKYEITFKLLDGKTEKAIDAELAGLKKIQKDATSEITTRLKHMILSVNGETETKTIRDFVDNYLLARDARALREHIVAIQPDIEMKTTIVDEDGVEEDVEIPVTLGFFWPESGAGA